MSRADLAWTTLPSRVQVGGRPSPCQFCTLPVPILHRTRADFAPYLHHAYSETTRSLISRGNPGLWSKVTVPFPLLDGFVTVPFPVPDFP